MFSNIMVKFKIDELEELISVDNGASVFNKLRGALKAEKRVRRDKVEECEKKKIKEHDERGENYYDHTDFIGRLPCDPHFEDSNYDINGDYVGE